MVTELAETPLKDIIAHCRTQAFDLSFGRAKAWKAEGEGRVLAGYLPIYFPREIIHAANGLAVGIMGAGDIRQIIRGDAYYQSYICHLPRGIVELALDGSLDGFDGFIFPSTCDVIRNLSGMFRLLKKEAFSKYMDFPQNFRGDIGGLFYVAEMKHVLGLIRERNGKEATTEDLNRAIALYNRNRRLLRTVYDIRQEYPWRLKMEELYSVIRAGQVIPVEEHNTLLEDLTGHIEQDIGEPMDNIRVVLSGAFCEQPPPGLIRTIENAGCYIVDDDLLIGSRWIGTDVAENTDDPLNALSESYLSESTFSSVVYDVGNPKGDRLAALARRRKADGVVFASPSFCDPALLDRPIMQNACDTHGVRYIALQYSENTGQFKVIREQVGAFSDSIKLWDDVRPGATGSKMQQQTSVNT